MINQQPFQKVSKAQRSLFIKIQPSISPAKLQKKPLISTQNHKIDNIDVLKSQIKQVKGRIVQSKLALVLSRKQQLSPEKLVKSDRMGIAFDHESSKKKMDLIRINLEKVYQREDETQKEQEQEGDIQMPLHLNGSFDDKDQHLTKNDLQHFQTSRYQASFPQTEIWKSARTGQANLTERRIKVQPAKPARQIFRVEDFKPKGVVKKAVKERNNHLLRQREKLNRSLEGKTNQMSTLQKYFNRSVERLPQYLNSDRSLSKQLKHLNIAKKQSQKIKIKLNKPSNNKSASGKITLRPRYQFQIPNIKADQVQADNKGEQNIDSTSDWEQLKKQVNKYEFVRKYLSESDIFGIYQHLKKNKIKQEKWPLFVVDQASKHMKAYAFK